MLQILIITFLIISINTLKISHNKIMYTMGTNYIDTNTYSNNYINSNINSNTNTYPSQYSNVNV